MERKPNRKFKYGNVILKAVDVPAKSCLGCYFNCGPGKSDCLEKDKSVTGCCEAENRSDNTNIVFIRICKTYEMWYVKALSLLFGIALSPVFVLGLILRFAGVLVLTLGFFMTLDFKLGADTLKSLSNKHHHGKDRP